MSGRSAGLITLAAVLAMLMHASCGPGEQTPAQPRVTMVYNAEEQPTEKSAVTQTLQAQLTTRGFSIQLEPLTNTVFGDRVSKGNFDALYGLWALDYDDPEGFLTDFSSKGSLRVSRYQNAEYDRLYQQGLAAATDAERTALWRQAVAILDRDLPWIPLYSNTEIFMMRPEATGFRSNAYQYYDYRGVNLADIRVSTDIDILTLDPAQVYDLGSRHVVTQAYEGLVAMDESSKFVPALASEWVFSEKRDALTFRLRANVAFHQASFLRARRTVTSTDVRASFERIIKSTSPYAFIFDNVQGVNDFKSGNSPHVVGFEIPNSLTFRIRFTGPFPTMLSWLVTPAAYILPAELPTNYDFAKGSAGTGPFVLTSWDGGVARLKAHTGYWQSQRSGEASSRARSLTIRVAKDATSLLSEFRTGRLDILNVPLALFPEILTPTGELREEWKKYHYRETPLNNLKFIAVNVEYGPLGKDVSLRRRFSDAIDRQAIVTQLLRGKGRVSRSLIPTGMAGFP